MKPINLLEQVSNEMLTKPERIEKQFSQNVSVY